MQILAEGENKFDSLSGGLAELNPLWITGCHVRLKCAAETMRNYNSLIILYAGRSGAGLFLCNEKYGVFNTCGNLSMKTPSVSEKTVTL